MAFSPESPPTGRTSAMNRRNAPIGKHEIGEAKLRERLRRSLRQPTVKRLAMPEDVLDHLERMLCPAPPNLVPQAGLMGLSDAPAYTNASATVHPPATPRIRQKTAPHGLGRGMGVG